MKSVKKILSEAIRMLLLLIAVSLVAFILITKAPIDPLVSYIGTNSTLSNEAKEEISEWYTATEIQEKFGMTLSAIYCLVSKEGIPKKKVGAATFYSKYHFP